MMGEINRYYFSVCISLYTVKMGFTARPLALPCRYLNSTVLVGVQPHHIAVLEPGARWSLTACLQSWMRILLSPYFIFFNLH